MTFWPRGSQDEPPDTTISLPMDEFEIVERDGERIILLDKVVGLKYTWTHSGWQFPKGARANWVTKLTGLNLE